MQDIENVFFLILNPVINIMKKVFFGFFCLCLVCVAFQQSVAAKPNAEPAPTAVVADRVPFWVISTFGYDGSYYKILVENKSGHRYYVWYGYSIGTAEGERVTITIQDKGYSFEKWTSIESSNGQTSSIRDWSKK
jgi:hypothetical protein